MWCKMFINSGLPVLCTESQPGKKTDLKMLWIVVKQQVMAHHAKECTSTPQAEA